MRRRRLILAVLGLVLILFVGEAYRAWRFYEDISASRYSLLSIKADLDLANLQDSEIDILEKQQQLVDAAPRLHAARRFVETDPLLAVTSRLPLVGKQTTGMKDLVLAADEAARTGLQASEVVLAFARYERHPNRTSIEEALTFLRTQEASMAAVDAGLRRLQLLNEEIPDGLIGPLDNAKEELSGALLKLNGLVEGYNRAYRLLPDLLGYHGARRYLILAQNDAELFPSGGLISSYAVATFENGRLVSMELEYFGTLFDRWQKQSGGEYIEPPAPLKNYLKRNFSWALGEAGWYPDFPTTAELAQGFVEKGDVPPTDGTIAIDLQFMAALLELLGPMHVPDYGVIVTAQNVEELTLELTRDENYLPGQPRKAFLSYLARAVVNQFYAVPKERWIDLLRLLDRMGRERHLQLHFQDLHLQNLSAEYGFDGGIVSAEGSDFLLVADTSVNSTKLNLVLKTHARLDLHLRQDGAVRSSLTYEIENPFPEWKQGRDPRLVSALMLEGVYGCYLRVYAPTESRLLEVRLDGRNAGAEQNDFELGHRVFGRFFPVLPGTTASVQFAYQSPGVVWKDENRLYHYQLYIQKQAGTEALPLEVSAALPTGARLQDVMLDGRPVDGLKFITDLRTDRQIEISYHLP